MWLCSRTQDLTNREKAQLALHGRIAFRCPACDAWQRLEWKKRDERDVGDSQNGTSEPKE